MTQQWDMTEALVRSTRVPTAVGIAAEAVVAAKGEDRRLRWILARTHVPMVIVDGGRRYVEANRPARLALRLSLEELRTLTIDDLTPAHRRATMTQLWTRLLDSGCVAGHY